MHLRGHRANYGTAATPSGPRPRAPTPAIATSLVHPESKGITVTQVQLYDTTLRDGMQGQGMSLSAAEKVRVVHALDALGVHFIEAGFPSSNPKELELFALLAEVELEQAQICAFGMTRRRDIAAEDDAALRDLVGCFAPGGHPRRQDLGAAPGEGDPRLAARRTWR